MKIKIRKPLLGTSVLIALLASMAFADNIKVDYDHQANFANYHTYSWGKVETSNPLWDARVKDAVNSALAEKGWTLVPSGGSVTMVAVKTTQEKPELNTFYDGFGGGWRWRGFGGFGESTTTVQNIKIGTLVVDMFDTNSKTLIWRGISSDALSENPEKNTKNLDKDVLKMFQHFPPKTAA